MNKCTDLPTVRLLFLLLSLAGYMPLQASTLTYNPDGSVVGYSLPGITSAGLPNFENPVEIDWKSNLKTKKGVTSGNASLAASYKDGADFLFNLDESTSYIFESGTGKYKLSASFQYDGSEFTLDPKKTNYLEINGTLDFDGSVLKGTLFSATLTSWNYSADLIGFNTSIDSANSLICTVVHCTGGESVYLGDFLAGFNFNPFDKKASFEGLSVATVPTPAAVWMFGSGLLGLWGTARQQIRYREISCSPGYEVS